jgi:hypothetical protein
VPSSSNPADGPSRGIYPPSSLLLPPITLPPGLEQFLTDSQSPLTPTERRLLREGCYPPAAAKCIIDADRRIEAGLQFSLRSSNSQLPQHRFEHDNQYTNSI